MIDNFEFYEQSKNVDAVKNYEEYVERQSAEIEMLQSGKNSIRSLRSQAWGMDCNTPYFRAECLKMDLYLSTLVTVTDDPAGVEIANTMRSMSFFDGRFHESKDMTAKMDKADYYLSTNNFKHAAQIYKEIGDMIIEIKRPYIGLLYASNEVKTKEDLLKLNFIFNDYLIEDCLNLPEYKYDEDLIELQKSVYEINKKYLVAKDEETYKKINTMIDEAEKMMNEVPSAALKEFANANVILDRVTDNPELRNKIRKNMLTIYIAQGEAIYQCFINDDASDDAEILKLNNVVLNMKSLLVFPEAKPYYEKYQNALQKYSFYLSFKGFIKNHQYDAAKSLYESTLKGMFDCDELIKKVK